MRCLRGLGRYRQAALPGRGACAAAPILPSAPTPPSPTLTAGGVLSWYEGSATLARSASARPAASPRFFSSLAISRAGSRMPWC
jgi:hypothetical protein